MSLIGYRSSNHPQQTAQRGASLFPEMADATDATDDRGTDPALFAMLDREFAFNLDVAASAENAKCARFFTRDDDGLVRAWAGSVWCNPPYSNIRGWVEKAWSEWRTRSWSPYSIVMLVPANRTEQGWWQELVEPHRDNGGALSTRFLAGRLRFVPGVVTAKGDRPPFGCCLLIWAVLPAYEEKENAEEPK